MNNTKGHTPTMSVRNIRPIRERFFIGLWALWAFFFVTPVLLSIAFGIATLPFEEVNIRQLHVAMSTRDLSEWRFGCAIFSAVVLCSGVLGRIAQFVVIGYASPARLLRGQA